MNFTIHKNAKIIFEDIEYSYEEIEGIRQSIASNILLDPKCQNNKILIYLDSSPECILSFFAVLSLGMTYIPVSTQTPKARLEFILEDCKPSKVITQRKYQTLFSGINVINVDALAPTLSNHNIFLPRKDDLAYIIYTSGTTGSPKGVEVLYKGISNLAHGLSPFIEATEGNTIACFTNCTFDIFFVESVLALSIGLTVVIANKEEQTNARAMISLIKRNNISILQITPTRLQMICEVDNTLGQLRSVHTFLVGGESFPHSLLNNLQTNTKARIYNLYGPTEASVWVSIADLTNEKHISIGSPIGDTQIYIVDEYDNPVEANTVGEIVIAGSSLARGYVNNRYLTQKKFVYPPLLNGQRVYKTGDLGKYSEGGELIYIGRIDNQIKYNGYRIEPEEIESVMEKYIGVDRALVFFENGLKAYYKPTNNFCISSLIQYLEEYLPSYMIPKAFIPVSTFYYTSNGKIDRKHNYQISNINTTHSNTPRTYDDIDLAIIHIITQEVHSTDELTPDHNMQLIGMDSLSFISIVVAIENKYNFQFDDEKLNVNAFKKVSDFIDYVKSKTNDKITTPFVTN